MGICQAIDFSFSVSASNRALRIKLTKYPQYKKLSINEIARLDGAGGMVEHF